jgi:hypothetical protein
MPLLNYTTKISTVSTINEITRILARVGVSGIMTDFEDGEITALSFKLKLNDQYIAFRLPTDWQPVLGVLRSQNVPKSLQTEEQAKRVAWRITKDWVEAQVAFVETMMVTTAQVFLPYAVTNNGQSLYEYIGQNTNLLLGDGK